jgi:G:T/U-mismatch repair DNA glycosylase
MDLNLTCQIHSATSPSSGKPYNFESKLRYGVDKIIPYEEQLKVLVNHGFALWDVIASCERPSSLDVDISNDVPNDIRSFCEAHVNIRRIVLANGLKQSELFAKHFTPWWESGTLRPLTEGDTSIAKSQSVKAFQKFGTNHFSNATIECVVGPGVSPAAASISYEKKRHFYETYCYIPGLKDHKRLNSI